ncbi:PucR family transcriptional regulator [Mycobacterium kubicae]|uniref:PucR family transcriptional regulator n=1 Tax=Mycobacterium kubicae TaxID=120959 RepID=UPI001F620290|nr:PucR family transcriptional regulator [Mycobacterium kubicae]
MVWRAPSPRIQELIRKGALMALNANSEWVGEIDRVTLAAGQSIAADATLAAAAARSHREKLVDFASTMLRNPGAMQRWTEIAFDLTSDPEELRALLSVPFQSAGEFLDRTLTGISAHMQSEHAELAQDIAAERRKIVELIVAGAPISRDHAESRLDYALDRLHTAAIVWCDQPDEDPSRLDRAVEAFTEAVGCARPLKVVPSAATRWVWVKDIAALDVQQLSEVLGKTTDARVAIGPTARGIEGFRRSHLDALTTQRMVTRLQSPQRVAFFADVRMVALLTENQDGADDFIKTTLGDFESASPTLHTTVLTYINAECNASRAAKLLYTHRNTLLNRLETAQRLLPRPLEQTLVEVAVAIKALQWRGNQGNDSENSGATSQHHGPVPTGRAAE